MAVLLPLALLPLALLALGVRPLASHELVLILLLLILPSASIKCQLLFAPPIRLHDSIRCTLQRVSVDQKVA